MRLQEKFDAIIGNTALDVQQLQNKEQLADVAHRPHSQGKLPYYFEHGSAVGTGWISQNSGAGLRNFIGAHSYINAGGYQRDAVLIGRYCSIGRRVTIAAGLHDASGLTTSPALQGVPTEAYTEQQLCGIKTLSPRRAFTQIQSDVWIGDGVTIMPGAHIGIGCIIGANAVVTKDCEPYGVYVGVPARQISRRFSDQICSRLLKSNWWDISTAILNKLPVKNVFQLLDSIDQHPPQPGGGNNSTFETFAYQS